MGFIRDIGRCTVNPVQYGISKRHCIGLPTIGREVRIVDEGGEGCSCGAGGRLVVRGEAAIFGVLQESGGDGGVHEGWVVRYGG